MSKINIEAGKAYGRSNERETLLNVLDSVGKSSGHRQEICLIHGRAQIGKSTIIRRMNSWTQRLELPGVAPVDLADEYTYDFFDKLMSISKTFRSPPFNYDLRAFEFAALNFDLQFRDGRFSSLGLAETEFGSANILSSSITDAIKSGATELVDQIKKTGLWGMFAGGMVGLSTGPALIAAVNAALVGGVAISAFQLVRILLKGAWGKAKKHSLFKRSAGLRELFSQQTPPTFYDYQRLLPVILAEDISRSAEDLNHFLVCMSLDPSDQLASDSEADVGRRLADCLTRLITNLDKTVVVTGARTQPKVWKDRALNADASNKLSLSPMGLSKLKINECSHEIEIILNFIDQRIVRDAISELDLDEIEPGDFPKVVDEIHTLAMGVEPYAD